MPKEVDIKRRRTRGDYVFHQTYRTRWYATSTLPFE